MDGSNSNSIDPALGFRLQDLGSRKSENDDVLPLELLELTPAARV